MKRCSKCRRQKELFEFPRDKARKDGYSSHCKQCRNDYQNASRDQEANNRQRREWWAALEGDDKARALAVQRNNRLINTYNITIEEYEEMLADQDMSCAICGKHATQEGRRLAVDHNHATKQVRGLLCAYCNRYVVGRHKDGALLRKAADYLDSPPAERTIGVRLVPKNQRRRRRKTSKKRV